MHGSDMDGFGDEKEQSMNSQTQTARIRELNDKFRRTGEGGQQFITPGISDMGMFEMLAVRQMVAAYDGFCEDNDPYGEHDFGSLTYEGEKMFWKIDYYDTTLTQGSPDPADPAVTTRVLTIMLAQEY